MFWQIAKYHLILNECKCICICILLVQIQVCIPIISITPDLVVSKILSIDDIKSGKIHKQINRMCIQN